MNSNEKRSIDEIVGGSLKKDFERKDGFLEEKGLARAIEGSKKLSADSRSLAFRELRSGHQLGDFEIESKLSQGGMGIIYSAIQRPLDRKVALKTVIPSKATSFALERFRRERKILGELHESNIVSVFAAGAEDEIEYFAMPYISGRSIKELVSSDKPSEMPISKVVQLLIELAEGTESIHQRGIIHRDITPNNVILGDDDRAWLIDFGIATKLESGKQSEPDLAVAQLSTDVRIGTPRYKAPELEQGVAGRQTDVYGLGVCLYCLLTGEDFSPNSNIRQDSKRIPAPLAAICTQALNEDPQQRYQTAESFAEDLRRWARHEPVSSKNYRTHQRMGLWLKRNPIKSTVTTSAFLLLVLASLAAINIANSRAKEKRANLESQLSKMKSVLASGNFEKAARLVSSHSEVFSASAQNDPDLFLNLVALLWRTEGIDSARKQIDLARKQNDDSSLLARLDLAEADVLYAVDFEQSELLARTALNSGRLAEFEVEYARALLSTNAVDEQRHLEKVVAAQPFHLRSQQLLVLNLLFLGQIPQAREQLASATSLFPDDPSLVLATAMLAKLAPRSKTNQGGVELQKWHDLRDSGSIPPKILDSLPDVMRIQAADTDRVMKELDRYLIGMQSLQKEMSRTGYVLIPPALHRALSNFAQPTSRPNSPNYWPELQPELKKLAEANPDMLFLFAYARSLYGQFDKVASNWMKAGDLLDRALATDSTFPIRPIVIQQLALVRVQNFYTYSGKTEQAKKEMHESLKLLLKQGRLLKPDNVFWKNLVEGALESKDWGLAEQLCERWRNLSENDNVTADQLAKALGASAVTAMERKQYYNAYRWSSKALEIAPSHGWTGTFTSVRRRASEQLGKIANELEGPKGSLSLED